MVIDLGPKLEIAGRYTVTVLCKVAEETFDEKLKASAQRGQFL